MQRRHAIALRQVDVRALSDERLDPGAIATHGGIGYRRSRWPLSVWGGTGGKKRCHQTCAKHPTCCSHSITLSGPKPGAWSLKPEA
jgi:hypothetical protein